jgi:hypothetical protein
MTTEKLDEKIIAEGCGTILGTFVGTILAIFINAWLVSKGYGVVCKYISDLPTIGYWDFFWVFFAIRAISGAVFCGIRNISSMSFKKN